MRSRCSIRRRGDTIYTVSAAMYGSARTYVPSVCIRHPPNTLHAPTPRTRVSGQINVPRPPTNVSRELRLDEASPVKAITETEISFQHDYMWGLRVFIVTLDTAEPTRSGQKYIFKQPPPTEKSLDINALIVVEPVKGSIESGATPARRVHDATAVCR
ncbi:hypothetical protein J6590_015106 [Homalodisca vitripennis]|nr:hypothetical protein J6590_015106 [Homalodisca vitripennis]